MIRSKFLVSLSATAALFCALSTTADAKTTAKNVPVQFLGINDLNGYIDSTYTNSAGKTIGGMASLAYNLSKEKQAFAKTNNLKSANTNSISVHTGDILGGGPAISSLLQDHPTISILNAMNFQLGVIGNHELNEGLDEFLRVIQGKKATYDTPNYDLVSRYKIEKSNTTILAANVINKKSKKTISGFKPYEIKTINGVKVGFIGVVDPYVQQLIMPTHTKNLSFTDPAKAIAKYDKVLRKKGIKAIVVLAHAGAENTGTSNQTIETQAAKPNKAQVGGSVTQIIDKLDKIAPNHSVDIVFGGHSHSFANGLYGKKNIRVVESLDYGKSYNVATGKISTTTNDFVKTPAATVKYNYTRSNTVINKNSVAKNVNRIVQNAAQLTATVTRAKIATLDAERLSSVRIAKIGGSAVGNLVADSQLALMKNLERHVDFAFTNSGGVRDDLVATVKDGRNIVTWEAAQKVQPFSNFLYTGQLTGAQITQVLNEQFSGGRGLEVAGLHYTYNDKEIVDVFVGDKSSSEKIVANKSYTVVLNNYLTGGGDNFPTFTKLKNSEIIGIDTDTFIDYLKAMKNVPTAYTPRSVQVEK